MNDNLDDFLNSLGIDTSNPANSEVVATARQVESDLRESLIDGVVSGEERTEIPLEEHTSYSLADDELDDILSDYGFQNPSEEIHDGSDDAGVEDEEEEEGSTSSESLEDERNTFNAAAAASFIRRTFGMAVINFVGNDELVNIGDFRVNPLTERVEVLTDNGIASVGQAFIDREARDLDAEEDADWQEAINSGRISRIEYDSDGREYITNSDGQRVYLHNEVVDAVNSTSSSVASNILARNRELIAADESATSEETAPATQNEPLIPLNSPTLLMDESTTRFSGAEWFNEIQKKSIIVAGCGGIGSNLIFQLARMKPAALFLYDDDMVEAVNMAGQLYARNDVGKSKVSAISDMITAYTNMQNVYAIQDRFTDSTEPGDIMICGFDNMEARRTFFFKWQAHVFQKPVEERKNCLYLDGRLSMTNLQVLCITGDNGWAQSEYESKYLFSDEEAEHTVCSMKQTTYLACMIGSIMVNLFTNFCANLLDPVIPYDLPFFTEYDAQNMIFKTIK